MSNRWEKVRLSEVLRHSEETVILQPEAEYKELTVKLWGKGVVLRGMIMGADVAATRRYIARSGQFVLSRIDARNGAFGIVPVELDGAIVSNDFPVFSLNKSKLLQGFLSWMSRTKRFVEMCQRASEGTTNRVRLQEERFLALEISIPSLSEQHRILARIDELAAQIAKVRSIRLQEEGDIRQMLLSVFWGIAKNAPRRPMKEIAPIVRRAVSVNLESSYPELGIRSFGKGTFHKPALTGVELNGKRIFKIEQGDLLFSNVFAWEGAIAVAKLQDIGRFGSHRFITCVVKPEEASARFLYFYFLTEEGMEFIRSASPGGAGRNRTLGLAALENITVPVPTLTEQVWFDNLQTEVDILKQLQSETAAELDALMPSILSKAFAGEL